MKAAWVLGGIIFFNATSGLAETISVIDNHGGSVPEYNQRWAELGKRGVSVRISGPCQSACTVLLSHIPRNKICVTPAAAMGFHLAKVPSSTSILWGSYPSDIQAWVNQHGGLRANFIWLRAPEIYRYFRRC